MDFGGHFYGIYPYSFSVGKASRCASVILCQLPIPETPPRPASEGMWVPCRKLPCFSESSSVPRLQNIGLSVGDLYLQNGLILQTPWKLSYCIETPASPRHSSSFSTECDGLRIQSPGFSKKWLQFHSLSCEMTMTWPALRVKWSVPHLLSE